MNLVKVLWIDCSPFCGGAQKSFGTMIRGLLEDPSRKISGRLFYSEQGAAGWGRDLSGLPGLEIRCFPCRHWRRSPVGFLQLLWDVFRWHQLLLREIRKCPPDLIHVNCCRAWLLLPWLFCRKIPVLVHDRDFRKPSWLMHFIACRKRVQVLTVSRRLGEEWTRRVPSVRWDYVPNPVEPVPVPAERPAGSRPVFALIADWVDWKNHALFVRALDCYREKFGDCSGIIQGRIHDRAGGRLRREILDLRSELGLEEILEVTADQPVGAVLARADVLVSCAEGEPFGRTVAEALQAGLCVAACGIGGPAEILAGCPAGFQAASCPESLAVKMHDAWENCRIPSVVEAARARGGEYLPEKAIGGIRRCYETAAKR